MNSGDIIKEAMKTMGWSQQTLAEKAGYVDENGKGKQSSVSSRINGNKMLVSTLVKLLDAMGYELVVRSTSPNTNKNEWKVSE